MLSIILPSFNEEQNILNTAEVLKNILTEENIPYELIFVDDGSRDGTWQKILQAAERDSRVRGVSFSRNFGKESAVFAGLESAKGDCCLVMDCDLQHPPKVIPEMYKKWLGGAEIVEGRKASRGKESASYGLFAKLFNTLIKKSSGIDMLDTSDFKLLDKKAVNALLNMPERVTFFRAMSAWVGFKTETVMFDVADRAYGERKWSTKSLVKYAINSLASYTNLPLVFPIYLGMALSLAALVFIILEICSVISWGMGTCIVILALGMILCSLGVLGYYLYRVFDEVRLRPKYIISHTVGGNND